VYAAGAKARATPSASETAREPSGLVSERVFLLITVVYLTGRGAWECARTAAK
jgi:hypothetical protein